MIALQSLIDGLEGEAQVHQTLINSALREYVEGKTPKWEKTLRRIIREEMARNSAA